MSEAGRDHPPDGDIVLITRAAAFAAQAHAAQTRKSSDQPYINHLLRVAAEAARSGLSAEAVAAALLHDTVEDTAVTQQDLRRAFPGRVAHLVQLLTQGWPDDAPRQVKEREKPGYYGAILKDPEAIALKLLDRADNLRDMVSMLPRARRWAQSYLRRTRDEVEPLARASHNMRARQMYAEALDALEEALRSPRSPQRA